MIQLVRIDDRLLHGQVAYSWKAALSYEAIVIANDNASADPIRKSALQLAKPDGVRIAIRSVDDAITLLKNEKIKALKVFVIVDNPQDALRIYKGIDETPNLNIGGVQSQDGRKELTQAVYFNESELEALDEIAERNINVSVKLVPSDSPQDYLNLRKK